VTFSIELGRETDGRWLAEVPGLAGVLCYGADRDKPSRASKPSLFGSSPSASNIARLPPSF
jgi:hypothetical protein